MTNTAGLIPGDDLGRGTPGRAAPGRGPNRGGKFSQEDDRAPAAGWGAAISVTKLLGRTREAVRGPHAILKMNHENGGFDCPGCAWPDDRRGLHLDICENGIRHVTWEMTRKKVRRGFFAAHTVTELSGWTDFALEDAGRLTRADGLRPGQRQVPANLLARRVRAARAHRPLRTRRHEAPDCRSREAMTATDPAHRVRAEIRERSR